MINFAIVNCEPGAGRTTTSLLLTLGLVRLGSWALMIHAPDPFRPRWFAGRAPQGLDLVILGLWEDLRTVVPQARDLAAAQGPNSHLVLDVPSWLRPYELGLSPLKVAFLIPFGEAYPFIGAAANDFRDLGNICCYLTKGKSTFPGRNSPAWLVPAGWG